MVDASESAESSNITVDLIKSSKSKRLIVLGEGEYREYDNKGKTVKKLVLPVEIDGKKKDWVINRPSSEKMIEAYDTDTLHWVGKVVKLDTIKTQMGQEMVIAFPEPEPKVTEEEISSNKKGGQK